ncbi:MAG TPA: tRNA (adenosine(37)-N6)-threonylcarbamoyltransferase complex dimerization subunit type 1 TsaB [bacterium]|nr:tRNA (adenosine(37)-N6)-threonylcarbamoyltransferase complex dimerization subunit type 1 TsaB [bacterium]
MRVLAIETASPIASVALLDAGGVLASRAVRAPMRHLEWVAGAIEGLLRDVAAGADSVEAVAVGRGPGGFTGLRIGIATAAAWGRARGVPVLGVGTLETLACAAGSAGLVLPLLDAHRGEVAAALYRLGPRAADLDGGARPPASNASVPEPRCLVPPVVAAPEVVVAEMRTALDAERAPQRPLVVAGDGLARHGGALMAALAAAGIPVVIERPDAYPRAETAGLLARPRLLRGLRDDASGLLPIYGRRLAVRPWQETPTRPGSED